MMAVVASAPALSFTGPSPPRPAAMSSSSSSSSSPRRKIFYAVRTGHQSGVFTSWREAETQISDFEGPVYKTFSTRMAAEAFVDGWDGAGRHSLPPSTPLPLREHLSPRPRQSGGLKPPRPHFSRNPSSCSSVSVRRSSPLRQEVTDQPTTSNEHVNLKIQHGLPSPPTSPEQGSSKTFATQRSIDSYNGKRKAEAALLSPPNSPPLTSTTPSLRSSPSMSSLSSVSSQSKRPAASRRASGGLWGDIPEPSPSPSAGDQAMMINGQSMNELFADKATPSFSRASLRKSGVVMPTAAPAGRPRPQSVQQTPSLPAKTSRWSLSSNTGGLSSLSKTVARKNSLPSFGDRLASLDMANAVAAAEFGQLPPSPSRSISQSFSGLSSESLDRIEPPRPAFMRRATSSSSLSSEASDSSFSSCHTSIPEEPEEVEPVIQLQPSPDIRCTVSEGDADGSVESTSSITSGVSKTMKKKKKGPGLGKRLMKALGLGKQEMRDLEARRGSA